MRVRVYKNTNFGNNEMVWNVPHPNYNFDSNHSYVTFDDVKVRFPLLTTAISLKGSYVKDTAFLDYMIITDDEDNKTYYFISSIIADRNTVSFSVVLDVLTTYNLLSTPISGTIVRKHDTNLSENRFDYPSALGYEGNYINSFYTFASYSTDKTRLIESTIDLTKILPSIDIPSDDGSNFTIPQLPIPAHTTDYSITSWRSNITDDVSHAFTLYLNDEVDKSVLNVIRGMAGDGAISDSYIIPSEAVTIGKVGAEVRSIRGRYITKTLSVKLSSKPALGTWVPKNEAILGMVTVSIMSLQEKTTSSFPGWDLEDSVDETGNLQVALWCDPKPSGAPYCCPTQVKTLDPLEDTGIINLATMEVKSTRGGQWLRNPLIYSTGKGEAFATVETQLQREKSEYERKVALQQLEMNKRERDIQIAQSDYNYQSGLASSLISGGASLASKDFGGLVNAAKGAYDSTVSQDFIKQMQDLKAYEQETEKTLINMAHTNNLKNLNVQEAIRRISPREVVFHQNESMGSYEQYNGFAISINIPDLESLKAKDMEFSKYGYPVYESVVNFKMLDHLRVNHTVYQFENPMLEIGGKIGDMARAVLEGGIRILSNKYTTSNILNNPKVGE